MLLIKVDCVCPDNNGAETGQKPQRRMDNNTTCRECITFTSLSSIDLVDRLLPRLVANPTRLRCRAPGEHFVLVPFSVACFFCLAKLHLPWCTNYLSHAISHPATRQFGGACLCVCVSTCVFPLRDLLELGRLRRRRPLTFEYHGRGNQTYHRQGGARPRKV